jgi:hypothetical protein
VPDFEREGHVGVPFLFVSVLSEKWAVPLKRLVPFSDRKIRLTYKFAGGSPAAGDFLLRGQEKVTKEKAAPMRWSFASRRTSLPAAKKRGASQLDLARHTRRAALRDSDKGSPKTPRFLASGRQRIGVEKKRSLCARSCIHIKKT